jgi:hypothetical protein
MSVPPWCSGLGRATHACSVRSTRRGMRSSRLSRRPAARVGRAERRALQIGPDRPAGRPVIQPAPAATAASHV